MNGHTAPHLASSALLTIDVQREFIKEGSEGREEKLAVVPVIARAAALFREQGLPVIHIVRIYLPDGSNADLCRREEIESGGSMLQPGSEEVQLVGDILLEKDIRLDEKKLMQGQAQKIGREEYILYKPRFGAFYGTALEEFLKRELQRDTLVIGGFNFPNCPRSTIYEASERDFRIAALKRGISHIYGKGMEELENIHVSFLSLSEIQENIKGIFSNSS